LSFEKRKTVTTPGGIIGEKIVIEQVVVNGSPFYAIKRGDSEAKLQSNFEVGGVIYYPLDKCPWKAPGEPLDYGSEEELFKEIRDFVYEHVDIAKDERFYDVLATWIMADWVQELFNNAPYIHFNGPSNSGKSRGLEVLQHLGFRALLSPSVSPASLYRTIEAFKPTFLIDEAELYTAKGLDEAKREVLSVLNAGYRRGQFVIRADKKGETLQLFDVFGFKGLASIQPLPPTLAGRAIRIPMMRATRKVKRWIDEDSAYKIRSKLLMFRFKHVLEKPKEGVNPVDVPDGRIVEVFTPLVLVAPNPKVEAALTSLAKELFEEIVEEELETEQAQVFLAVLDCMKEGKTDLLEVAEITEKYNEGRPKNEQITKNYCGRILSTLGFKKKRTKTGNRRIAVVLDQDLINRLKIRYGIVEQKTLTQPAPQVTLTKENVEKVFEALANASKLRGSATTEEVAMEAKLPVEVVKACLEALQREGRVYQPFPDWWKLGR
jgi:hypothetical protein